MANGASVKDAVELGGIRLKNLENVDTLRGKVPDQVRLPILTKRIDPSTITFDERSQDVTGEKATDEQICPRQIFIIHGHDPSQKFELEKILRDEWNLRPLILTNEPGKGRPLIQKFEAVAKGASYAFAIMTPDDVIGIEADEYRQARPNVMFVLGWFYGRLGSGRFAFY